MAFALKNKFNVGDKIFRVDYLNHLGDARRWLKMNMKPFSTVAGAGIAGVWGKAMPIFSHVFKNVREAAQAPMNSSELFDQETGKDVDRQLNRFLHVTEDIDEIKQLVDASVAKSVKEKSNSVAKRITDLKRQIEQLRQEEQDHIEFCNQCRNDIIDQCKPNGDES